jgi:hypothetical protein
MLNIIKSKFFKFAAFAAKSQGMGQVQPIVVHRNGNAALFGRFGRHR